MRQRKLKWASDYLKMSPLMVREFDESLETIFGNKKPIEIEIGCGKGQFIYQKAKRNLDVNYLGIDIQGSVLAIALKKSTQEQLTNVRYCLLNADKLLEKFGEGAFKTIYLNFSDPWPKARHAKRRLTAPSFLSLYYKLLDKDGKIIFKSDNVGLYEYSVETFKRSSFKSIDFDPDYKLEEGEIISEYETKFRGLGQPIGRIIASKE